MYIYSCEHFFFNPLPTLLNPASNKFFLLHRVNKKVIGERKWNETKLLPSWTAVTRHKTKMKFEPLGRVAVQVVGMWDFTYLKSAWKIHSHYLAVWLLFYTYWRAIDFVNKIPAKKRDICRPAKWFTWKMSQKILILSFEKKTSKILMQRNLFNTSETVTTIVQLLRSIGTISQSHRKSTSGTILRGD